jgi:hypothetical protein
LEDCTVMVILMLSEKIVGVIFNGSLCKWVIYFISNGQLWMSSYAYVGYPKEDI